MAESGRGISTDRPAGYEALIEWCDRDVFPNWRWSQVNTAASATLPLDEDGCMTVHNDTARLYRSLDMELARELAFWPTMTWPRKPSRRSWTCPIGRSSED